MKILISNKNFHNKNLENENDYDGSDNDNEVDEDESASLHDEMNTNKSFSDEEIYVTLYYHKIILRSYHIIL